MRKPKKQVVAIGAITLLLGVSYSLFFTKTKVDMSAKLYGTYQNKSTKDITIHSFTTESETLNNLIETIQTQTPNPATKTRDYKSKLINDTYVSVCFQEKDKSNILLKETPLTFNLKTDTKALLSEFFNPKAIRYLTYQHRKEIPQENDFNTYLENTDVMNLPFALNETSLTLNAIEYSFAEYPNYLTTGDSATLPNVSLNVPVTKKPIALTFDDGPSEANTRKVMDILESYNGQGTFFVMGPRANTNHDLIKETLDRNHQLGSHTYNHKNLTKLTDAELNFEIYETERILQAITQTNDPLMVRPPYGAINNHIKETTPRTFINWNIDSNDWRKGSTERVCKEIVQDAKENGIVLMHDLYDETVTSLRCATEKLDQEGYQFVSVDTLLRSQGITIESGKVYYNAN